MSASRGWIGVDLDGTLAHYDCWVSETHVGRPIPAMVERVKAWLAQDIDVRIVTARVSPGPDPYERKAATAAIRAWCLEHIGKELPVTNAKDYGMTELYDDRAVQVIKNTGEPATDKARRDAISECIDIVMNERLTEPSADDESDMAYDSAISDAANALRRLL